MTAHADSELSEIHRTLAAPSPEFDAWVASMDNKLWARFDLSAARLGWEAAKAQGSPPMTAPADSRISDEMNGQSAGHPIEQLLIDAYVRGVEWCEENPLDREYRFKAARDYADKALTVLASLAPQQPLTELRERRAQAVTATLYVEQRSLDDMPPGGQHYIQARKQPGGNFAVPLYAAPPPAQAAFIETRNESAGFTEYVLEDETTVSRPVSGELLMSLDRTRVVGFRAYDAPPAQAAGVTEGWQPIETAPKDKTPVLLCVPSMHEGQPPHVGEAYFDPENPNDGGDWWWAGTNWGDYYASSLSETNAAPTHWSPLPEPPPSLSAQDREE